MARPVMAIGPITRAANDNINLLHPSCSHMEGWPSESQPTSHPAAPTVTGWLGIVSPLPYGSNAVPLLMVPDTSLTQALMPHSQVEPLWSLIQQQSLRVPCIECAWNQAIRATCHINMHLSPVRPLFQIRGTTISSNRVSVGVDYMNSTTPSLRRNATKLPLPLRLHCHFTFSFSYPLKPNFRSTACRPRRLVL